MTFNVAIFRNAKPTRAALKDAGRAIIAREKNNSFSRASSCPGQARGSLKRMILKTRFGGICEWQYQSIATSREMPSLKRGPTCDARARNRSFSSLRCRSRNCSLLLRASPVTRYIARKYRRQFSLFFFSFLSRRDGYQGVTCAALSLFVRREESS